MNFVLPEEFECNHKGIFFDFDTDEIENKTPDLDFRDEWINEIIDTECKTLGYVSFMMMDDEALLKINIQSLNHDYYTDIISFQYNNNPIEGEICVSITRVLDNSIQNNQSYADEFTRVLAHGILHFCGYKDKEEEDIITMRDKEEFYLNLWNKKYLNANNKN